jgi:hypothetical protein
MESLRRQGACEASWQTDARFRCAQTDPLPSLLAQPAAGGSGGSTSGTGGTPTSGTCTFVAPIGVKLKAAVAATMGTARTLAGCAAPISDALE